MLFNSVEFLLAFLPVTIVGFFLIGARSRTAAAWWLALASIVFYAGWSWKYVPLLVGSAVFNFHASQAIVTATRSGARNRGRALLAISIAADLMLLGYFKYADFFLGSVNWLAGTALQPLHLVLPLGISFFTFTQIAFLVDALEGKASEPRFSHYLLFVTYFPHLIAGPVLHHKEMMPQFGRESTYHLCWRDIAVGVSIFAIGLFKKTVLADGIAQEVGPVFASASHQESLHLLQAWGGVLAYTMQIYFDFSGYSDMAIGLSRMFGITLPLNFDSPYKAANISDFWRRWHMTLSRFLRDYLYIPLGGNRHGKVRRYLNLVITMFLGGLWHGASWTFAVWGLLHGVYLAIHHAFQALTRRLAIDLSGSRLARWCAATLTFVMVAVGWVFFRAPSFDAAAGVLAGMAGLHGVTMPDALFLRIPGLQAIAHSIGIRSELGGGAAFVTLWSKLLGLFVIVFLFPNTQELLAHFAPALDFSGRRRPSIAGLALRINGRWAAAIGTVLALGLLAMTRRSEFLYYQF